MHAEKAFDEYAELDSEEDCAAFISMEVDFIAGFRTCHAIMVEEQKQMRELIQGARDLCEARFRPGAGIYDDALNKIVGKMEEVYCGK